MPPPKFYDQRPIRRVGIPFNYRTPEEEEEFMQIVRQNPTREWLYAKSMANSGAASMAGRYRNERQPKGFRVRFRAVQTPNDKMYPSVVMVQYESEEAHA